MANDELPIDEAWLRSVGFRQHNQEVKGWLFAFIGHKRYGRRLVLKPYSPATGLGAITEIHDETLMDQVQIVRLPHLKNRGDVLRLCAGLKITLKDSPNAK